jgi:transcription initiation factor IIF auxiliary subunit
LIEEENEPIDLYIKKIETTNEEEIEHLLQFSYNNKVLDIFVDEIILYESINKSNSDSIEYNDTKTILEKFIFLTETYHKKLKDEISKQNEERRKKRQLQQIFKGF